jgi:hypothetical protein
MNRLYLAAPSAGTLGSVNFTCDIMAQIGVNTFQLGYVQVHDNDLVIHLEDEDGETVDALQAFNYASALTLSAGILVALSKRGGIEAFKDGVISVA